MAAANPRKRRRSGNRARRRNRGMSVSSNPKRRRYSFAKHHHRRRRSNPNILGSVKGTVIKAVWAIGGGVVTRSVPQALLGNSNTGIMGYLANIVTAFGGGALVGRFAGPDAGSMFAIGGSVMIVGRLFEDFVGRQFVSFANVDIPVPATVTSMLGSDRAFNFKKRLRGDFVPLNTPIPYSSLPARSVAAISATAGAGAGASKPPSGAGGLAWGRSWN